MDELDKNLPDDFWRKTFEDASEMPPPRVWATIEQRLDESSGPKILPLWGTGLASSRSLIWGAGIAAAVALLLVGWWAINSQPTKQSVAQVQPVGQANNMADSNSQPAIPTDASPTSHARHAQTDAVASTTAKSVAKSAHSIDSLRSRSAVAASQNTQSLVAQTDPKSSRGRHSQNGQAVLIAASTARRPMESQESVRSSRSMATTSYTSGSQSFIATDESSQNTVVFNKLNVKPLRMRRPGSIQRIVWIRPVDILMEPEINKSKRQSRELWASVNMMPGSFNPMVSVRPVQSSFSNTALASANMSSQSSVSSRANYSMAYQAGAGVQLSERWSVESGIGYLSGHASVESTGQLLATGQMDLLANRTGTSSNAYVDALRNSSQ
ncbi:MAG: anti-sigma factor, partial [Cytophagaceae bacterium]